MKYAKRPEQQIIDLINLPLAIYREKYPEDGAPTGTLKSLKSYYKKQLKGVNMEQQPRTNVDRVAELLERSGIDPNSIERMTRVNLYQGYMKNADNEFETVDLVSAQFVPKRDVHEGDYISQADPVEIRPVTLRRRKENNEYERIIVLPDMQVAFRRFDDQLQPTHSPEAIEIALQVIQDYQPHQIILNGDNLDFPQLGRFQQDPSFRGTFKETVNYMHQLLARIRANAPKAKIVYIAGNHEERMEKYIASRAPEFGEMYRAGSDQKLHSIPFLLNLEAIGNIEYIDGYPAGKYWLSDDLKAIHGHTVGSGSGATVGKVIKQETNSSTFGHIHRIELAWRTLSERRNGQEIGRMIVAASFGCLADITGRVPSYHSGNTSEGTPVREVENWQNGLGRLEIERSTGRLAVCEAVFIDTFHPTNPFQTRFNNRTYNI